MEIRLDGNKGELDFFVSLLRAYEINFDFNGKFYPNRYGEGYRIYLVGINTEELYRLKIQKLSHNFELKHNRGIRLDGMCGDKKFPQINTTILGGKKQE